MNVINFGFVCYLQEDHVEGSEEFANKAKNFFSVAVETWDADFYMKVDDDVLVNIGMSQSIIYL